MICSLATSRDFGIVAPYGAGRSGTTPHRVLRTILQLFVLILFLSSCSILEGPEEISNPMDPNDPDFAPPTVTFLQAPVEGEIVDTSYVTFEWEGNQPSMNFSYKMDNNDWTEWSTEKSVEFNYLDESSHSFEIKSRYFNGVESDMPQRILFSVDDVQGPALIFFPRLSIVTSGLMFSVEIMAEDVANLAGAKVVVNFNPSYLQVQEIIVYADDRSIFKTNGGTVIPFYEYNNSEGSLKIESGVATGDPPGVDGTGAIAFVMFQTTSRGTTEIVFNTSSEMRTPDNESILLSEIVEGVVIIE
ncbi:MAG: hypothetical protein IIA61_08960 [Candidatus Marinimicrobia bacterium]|nr:hypothetical protein [Candidatus Neomarinimicrobiota bacterium]